MRGTSGSLRRNKLENSYQNPSRRHAPRSRRIRGSGFGLKCAVLVGGVDLMQQQIALGKQPHIIVGTPGRLMDHLTNTKGFSLSMLKYLVKKLQRACLRNPVKMSGCTSMVFTRTCDQTRILSLLLRDRNVKAVFISSQMTQANRLESLNKFKSGQYNVLVCTDLAVTGLDIPSVDMVINYDIPTNPKVHIHQVGRTALAGRSGLAISLVNQYELEEEVMQYYEEVADFRRKHRRNSKKWEAQGGGGAEMTVTMI
ncbi:hypothetical protein J1N35_020057 [Gossypium stocksii]|uniref:Helicase C-terminal domain-containing protein n=1 Tax=Gossypium stocksii TaxID=47602 RepID=A0A9D3VCI3_9ROSI|nr:hypothetical protein J1N35_020057 [Gossypium stocksii]